jgi:hypothetical protein
MIATPGQRDRLMQRLRAETCVRRKNGSELSRNRRNELIGKEHCVLGTLSPDPWDLSRYGHPRSTSFLLLGPSLKT